MTPHPVDGPSPLRDAAARALELGRSVAGTTAPNPAVGCVILRDGRIVGEGATSPAGGPHAEVRALAAAGPLARGATAVVTLEPCAHVGRTPPCTQALLAAGIGSVRYLVTDPHPHAGGGAMVLTAAGVDVRALVLDGPDLAELVVRAEHDLRGFLTLVGAGRPHVLLKLAQLADGRMVDPASSERYLTGIAARRRVHELRADVDAVLVGSGTVSSDDPRLDARDVAVVRQPRPVVLATSAALPLRAHVVRRGALVLVGEECGETDVRALAAAGAEVHRVPTVVTAERRSIHLPAALERLSDLGIMTVLAEPGPRLARAMLAADAVDEVELHVARCALGAAIVPAVELAPDRFTTTDVRAVGEDLLVRARRQRSPSSLATLRPRAVA